MLRGHTGKLLFIKTSNEKLPKPTQRWIAKYCFKRTMDVYGCFDLPYKLRRTITMSGGRVNSYSTLQMNAVLYTAFQNCFKDVFNVTVNLITSNDIKMRRVYERGMHKVKIKDSGHKVSYRSVRLREGQSVGVVMEPVNDDSVWNRKHVSL